MELNEAKILIDKYYDGKTTLSEEQALHAFLAEYDGTDTEFQTAKVMFGVFGVVKADTLSKTVKVRRPKVQFNLRRVVSYAAACIVLALVVFAGMELTEPKQEPMLVCHINGVLVDDELVAQAEATKILSSVFHDVDNAVAEVNRITGYSSRR